MNPEDLSPEQVEQLKAWAEEGLELGDIQNKIEEEFETRLTFMDTRFLIDDLGIELGEDEVEEEEEVVEEPQVAPAAAPAQEEPAPIGGDEKAVGAEALAGAGAAEATAPKEGGNPFAKKDGQAAPAEGGDVSVTIDQINVPGTMLSGKVVFPDGKSSGWYIDQGGSLGLDPEEPGYRPSEADLLAFQRKLQAVLAEQGM